MNPRFISIFALLTATVLANPAAFAEGAPQLSNDATDWIRAEAPAVKKELADRKTEAERQALLADVVKTVSSQFFLPTDVKKRTEARRLLEAEIARLDRVEHWENLVPKLSPTQAYTKNFYARNMKVSFGDAYLADSWVSRLDIEAAPATDAFFRKYGVIQLRGLVAAENPKLVIGCGNRVKTEPSQDYRPNPHAGDDTVDPILRRNASVVGFFGDPDHQGARSVFPPNHYRTVFDEGIVHIDSVQWKEIERVLMPGGFFLGESGMKNKLPKHSRMRLHSLLSLKSDFDCPTEYGIHHQTPSAPEDYRSSLYEKHLRLERPSVLVFAKLRDDGTLPEKLRASDLPSGMKIGGTERVSLPEANYIE